MPSPTRTKTADAPVVVKPCIEVAIEVGLKLAAAADPETLSAELRRLEQDDAVRAAMREDGAAGLAAYAIVSSASGSDAMRLARATSCVRGVLADMQVAARGTDEHGRLRVDSLSTASPAHMVLGAMGDVDIARDPTMNDAVPSAVADVDGRLTVRVGPGFGLADVMETSAACRRAVGAAIGAAIDGAVRDGLGPWPDRVGRIAAIDAAIGGGTRFMPPSLRAAHEAGGSADPATVGPTAPVIPAGFERVVIAGLVMATANRGMIHALADATMRDDGVQAAIAADPLRAIIITGIAASHPTHAEQAVEAVSRAVVAHAAPKQPAMSAEGTRRSLIVGLMDRPTAVLAAMGPLRVMDGVGDPTADPDGGMTVHMPVGDKPNDLMRILASIHGAGAIAPACATAIENAVRDRVGPWFDRVDALIRMEDGHRAPGSLVSPRMRGIHGAAVR